MGQVTAYAAGTPSWVDLTTSDPEGARAFYRALFGWEFEIGGPETGHYTMCSLQGLPVAGMNGEPASPGMPPSWITYLATDDVEASAQRLTEHGAKLMMGPMEVLEHGSMALGFDPTGAVFGVWQAGAHIGAALVNEPGAIVWNELVTRDLDTARTFYGALFGYGWQSMDIGGERPYQMFTVGERVVGGMMQMPAGWPAEVPSHWTPYFQVAQADEAAAEAERLGGAVTLPPAEASFGRFAALRDPQGAAFNVVQPPPL